MVSAVVAIGAAEGDDGSSTNTSAVSPPPDGFLSSPLWNMEGAANSGDALDQGMADGSWTFDNFPWVVHESRFGSSFSPNGPNADNFFDAQKQTNAIWIVLVIALLFGLLVGVVPILLKQRAARKAAEEEAAHARREAFRKSAQHGRPLPLPPSLGAGSSSSLKSNRCTQPKNYDCHNVFQSPRNYIIDSDDNPESYFMLYHPKSAPPPRFKTPPPGGSRRVEFAHVASSREHEISTGIYDNIDSSPGSEHGRRSNASSFRTKTSDSGYVPVGVGAAAQFDRIMLTGGDGLGTLKGSAAAYLDAAASTVSSLPLHFSSLHPSNVARSARAAEVPCFFSVAGSGNGVRNNGFERRQTSTGSAVSVSVRPPIPNRGKPPPLPTDPLPEVLPLRALARSPDFGRFRAQYTFAGDDSRQIAFNVGDLLFVHDQSHQDWWAATAWPSNEFGFVPSSYLGREDIGYSFSNPISLGSMPSLSSNRPCHAAGFGGYNNDLLDWDAADILTRISPDIFMEESDEETEGKTGHATRTSTRQVLNHGSQDRPQSRTSIAARHHMLANRIASNI